MKWNNYDKIEKLIRGIIEEIDERKKLIEDRVSAKHCEIGLDEMLRELKKAIK